jgi:hypothetical protein
MEIRVNKDAKMFLHKLNRSVEWLKARNGWKLPEKKLHYSSIH